jgi:hypothetical protein
MPVRNSELINRLREAGGVELLELVREHAEELDAGTARLVLKNPHTGSEVVEILLEQRRLLSSQEFRRDLAGHRRTPEVQALNLIPGLFWRDLMKLGASFRARPRVRRAADLRLAEKLATLSTGERAAIARQAGPGTITRLRHDSNPHVIGALLENSRLTEGLLGPLLSSDNANPQVLARVAEDRRWGLRYEVRVMLSRNPRTPVTTVLGILSGLKKRDLNAVAVDWRISAPVRQRANLLLGRGPE